MMLSGCGYPHGTTGNRSEREINPLQVSDLEWLARTGQCGVIDLALLAFHIKWNDQFGGAYAFLSGWNVLPAFFICSEIYITVSMKVRNENFISSGLSIYSGVSAGEAQYLVYGREIYSAVRVGSNSISFVL